MSLLTPIIFSSSFPFFFNDTATTEIYTLSLHDALPICDQAREATLRTAARVSWALLDGMARKQWIVREDVSHATDAARTRQVAVLKRDDGKLNANQRLLVEALAA